MTSEARTPDIGWLLEAIGKVRSQKQRPNVERIFAAIRNKDLSYNDVVRHLEAGVKSHQIVCIENVGGVSYRDASAHKSTTTAHKTTSKPAKDVDLTESVMLSVKNCPSSVEDIAQSVKRLRADISTWSSDVLRRHVTSTCKTLVRDRRLVVNDSGIYSISAASPLRTEPDSLGGGDDDDDDNLTSSTSSAFSSSKVHLFVYI